MNNDSNDSLVYQSRYTSSKNILYFRSFVFAILTFTVVSNRIIETLDGEPLSNFKYFSIQTLHFMFLWYLLALLWRNDNENFVKLEGRLRGGLLTYTLVVTIVYYLLLFESQDGGINGFNNIVMHLLGTIFFIIDFLLTQQHPFEWTDVIYWLSYPFIFLIFSIIYDLTGGDPIYNFLTIDTLSSYLTWVVILISVFIIIGLLWIGLSKLMKSTNKN